MNTEDLVRELAHDAVQRVEPTQADMFDLLSPSYLADPERALRAATEKNDPLAAGVLETAALLIPIVIVITQAVTDQIMARMTDKAIDKGAESWRNRLHRKRRPTALPATTFPLTPQLLTELRQSVLEKGADLGLPDTTTRLLADAIEGNLAARRRDAG